MVPPELSPRLYIYLIHHGYNSLETIWGRHMIKSIFGAVAVIAFLILKFTGVQLDNVGTTSIDAVSVNRPVSETYKAFVDGSKLTSDLGKLSDAPQITVSLEPNTSITYRISSTIDSDGTSIKINFGNSGANSSTISAEIDVADVRQGNKYISEDKVRKMLKDDINDIAYALNKNNVNEAKFRDINFVMISLAALTNAKSEGEAETLALSIAEKSIYEEDATDSSASNETMTTKSSSTFGAPVGITGAPSAPLSSSSSDSSASFSAQQSNGTKFGDPTTDLGK
jgi:hypothetical protein